MQPKKRKLSQHAICTLKKCTWSKHFWIDFFLGVHQLIFLIGQSEIPFVIPFVLSTHIGKVAVIFQYWMSMAHLKWVLLFQTCTGKRPPTQGRPWYPAFHLNQTSGPCHCELPQWHYGLEEPVQTKQKTDTTYFLRVLAWHKNMITVFFVAKSLLNWLSFLCIWEEITKISRASMVVIFLSNSASLLAHIDS